MCRVRAAICLCVSSCQASELEGKGQNLVLGFREGFVPGWWKWEDQGGLSSLSAFVYLYSEHPFYTEKWASLEAGCAYCPMLKAWHKVKGWCEHVFDSFLVLFSDDLAFKTHSFLHWGRHWPSTAMGYVCFRLIWLHTEKTWKPPVCTEQPSSSLVVPWVIWYKHCLHGNYCTVFSAIGNAELSLENVFGIVGQRARWVNLANEG